MKIRKNAIVWNLYVIEQWKTINFFCLGKVKR